MPISGIESRADLSALYKYKGNKLMRQLNVGMLFVCFAALLFVFACADSSKKPAETPSQTAGETTETATQTAEANIQEVTLNVTGMT